MAGNTVSLHGHPLGLSEQTPYTRAVAQDSRQVAAFLTVKFPRIQRLAAKRGAEIGFEDEAGVEVSTRSGRT